MTVKTKLTVHLETIVMPLGVPMTAKQVTALTDAADEPQRRTAIDRARSRIPFLLPEEETEAEEWARTGRGFEGR